MRANAEVTVTASDENNEDIDKGRIVENKAA